MRRTAEAVLAATLVLCGCTTSRTQQLEVDHVILYVSRDAPERAALERAGFRVAPGVNEHEGQGTASVTIEFANSFLELLWPDERVPVAPGFERAYEKFQKRSQWRTTGWSPVGLALHRAGPVRPLPVPSWSVAPEWMEPGTAIEMLTPRDDTRSPSVSIHPHPVSENPALDTSRTHLREAGALEQPNGVRRLTRVRLIAPIGYEPTEALRYLDRTGALSLDAGSGWTVELTFDRGAQKQANDFRPELPLVVKY
jgi:hypothetical protein